MSVWQAEPCKLHDPIGTLDIGSAQMLAATRVFRASHDPVNFALTCARSSLSRQKAQVLATGFALEHLPLSEWTLGDQDGTVRRGLRLSGGRYSPIALNVDFPGRYTYTCRTFFWEG
jgi:hypothetical protein